MTRIFAAAALAATLAAAPASGLTVTMVYEDAAPGAPPVGTGTLTLGTDPGNGAFPWADLDGPVLAFTFPDLGPGGADLAFGNADIITPLGGLFVLLDGAGPTREFRFGGDGGGALGGSLDLQTGDGSLSHQPGGGFLYSLSAGVQTFPPSLYLPGGETVSSVVPLPAAGWLGLVGVAALAGLRRRTARA